MRASVELNGWVIIDASYTTDRADPTRVRQWLYRKERVPGCIRVTECWGIWKVELVGGINVTTRTVLQGGSEQEASMKMDELKLPYLEHVETMFDELYADWAEDPMTEMYR
jgi:hypothetical protein